MNYSDTKNDAVFHAYMALLSVSTRMQQLVDQHLREQFGITQAQFEILAGLMGQMDGRRMAELADDLLLSRSGLTYQMKQLEERGLVRRERDTDDDRGVVAYLTEQGRALVAKALPAHTEFVHRLAFDGLKEQEINRLAGALDDISKQMDGAAQ